MGRHDGSGRRRGEMVAHGKRAARVLSSLESGRPLSSIGRRRSPVMARAEARLDPRTRLVYWPERARKDERKPAGGSWISPECAKVDLGSANSAPQTPPGPEGSNGSGERVWRAFIILAFLPPAPCADSRAGAAERWRPAPPSRAVARCFARVIHPARPTRARRFASGWTRASVLPRHAAARGERRRRYRRDEESAGCSRCMYRNVGVCRAARADGARGGAG